MPRVNGTENVLLTTDKIAKASLALWKNNLIFAKSVYRDLDRQFGEIGDTVSVRLPNNVIVNSGRVATTTTPMVDKTVSLTIDQQRNVKFNWTQKDKELSIIEFSARYLSPATTRLANELDMDIADEIEKLYFPFGTVGSDLSIKDITLGKAYASKVGVPNDGLSRLIVDPVDGAELADAISGKYNPEMVKGAIRKGYIGEIAGYEVYQSPNMPTHTVGSYTGTEQVAADLHYGNQLSVSGSAAGAFAVGDMFTIAGVYEINPITKQRTGRLQTFTVLDGTLTGTSGTVTISPTLNDGTGTTTDADGNTVSLAMDQNVDGYAASGAAINFIGTAGKTYRQAVILHKHSIALVVISMKLPKEAHPSVAHDAQSGLSIAVSRYWNGDNYEDSLRLDILWGVAMIRPDLSFRAFTSEV